MESDGPIRIVPMFAGDLAADLRRIDKTLGPMLPGSPLHCCRRFSILLVDGQLAGGDGGAPAVAFVKQFQQVAAIFRVGFGQSPVVEDQDLGSGESGQQFGVASVAFGESQFAQQLGEAEVLGGMAFAAGFVGQRASQPGFADPGGAGDHDVEVFAHPLTAGQ